MSDFYNGGNGGGGGGTPAITELFEVYIDKNNSANNKNVSYSDIVNSINSEKLVYLKILYTDNSVKNFYFERYAAGYVIFVCVQWKGMDTLEYRSIYIDSSNVVSEFDYNVLNRFCVIDESSAPIYKKNIDFAFLSNVFVNQPESDIILYYTNSSYDRYKLRAAKLTPTEIMFSVYDPSTSSNLSIIVDDNNNYTVIT